MLNFTSSNELYHYITDAIVACAYEYMRINATRGYNAAYKFLLAYADEVCANSGISHAGFDEATFSIVAKQHYSMFNTLECGKGYLILDSKYRRAVARYANKVFGA